ncbi:MAG: hypothetical protein DRI33_03205 [Caldiserica bacterium]|nr:MAG: hypothetical protein DRI33_03205 [Caldisericota bacterium]
MELITKEKLLEKAKELSEKITFVGADILRLLANKDINELEGAYICANVASYLITLILARNNLNKEQVVNALNKYIEHTIDMFLENLDVKAIDSEFIRKVYWEE